LHGHPQAYGFIILFLLLLFFFVFLLGLHGHPQAYSFITFFQQNISALLGSFDPLIIVNNIDIIHVGFHTMIKDTNDRTFKFRSYRASFTFANEGV
jgi:hypothetical protein